MANPSGRWTDELVQKLKDLWPTQSAEMIRETLLRNHGAAFSRNAVIGKAHRLGLDKKTAPPPTETKARPKASPDRKATRRATPPRAESEAPKVSPIEFIPRVVDVQTRQLTFQQLNDSICKYECTSNDNPSLYRFCGRPTHPGKPYCLAHCRIAYIAPASRNNKREAA
jgi:GcrA cell cycle regulator